MTIRLNLGKIRVFFELGLSAYATRNCFKLNQKGGLDKSHPGPPKIFLCI